MKIELKEITAREVSQGYENNDEEGGVIGYGGKLNIRPKYQREFIYDDKKRNAVIETIRNDFPLNVMYWVKNEDGTYEVLDGQQRTISICEYVKRHFSIKSEEGNTIYIDTSSHLREQILDYKLMVYFCEGSDKEKLDWFKTINIAGEKLTDQELRNAIYSGSWLSDAKRYFSKTQGPAYAIAGKYLNGKPSRQDYLETAIDWISENNIEQYMANHQHDKNAGDLWLYFRQVINWVEFLFPKYRKEMKGLPFGTLYNELKDDNFNPDELETEITLLMMDYDVKKKSGIYQYVLTRDEKYLNIRSFSDSEKRGVYERQGGICKKCGEHFELNEMEADHITPWSQGGKTIPENCQMLCKSDNRTKSNK